MWLKFLNVTLTYVYCQASIYGGEHSVIHEGKALRSIFNACLKSSNLLIFFERFTLRTNMRVLSACNEESSKFTNRLLKIDEDNIEKDVTIL